MTPRRIDWRAVQPKLRKIDELLDRLRQLGEFDEKSLVENVVAAIKAIKADQVSLRLQNDMVVSYSARPRSTIRMPVPSNPNSQNVRSLPL